MRVFVITYLIAACAAQNELKVKLPDDDVLDAIAKKSAQHKKAVAMVKDMKMWNSAAKKVADNTGLVNYNVEIMVAFKALEGEDLARGIPQGGRGVVIIDMDKLAGYIKRVDQFEIDRKKENTKVVVPPLKYESIFAHELTHCFQKRFLDSWIQEGAASFATGDDHYFYVIASKKDLPMTRPDSEKISGILCYGRGHAFFHYLQKTYGVDKVKELMEKIFKKGKQFEDSLKEITGKEPDDVYKEELEHFKKFIKKYRRK